MRIRDILTVSALVPITLIGLLAAILSIVTAFRQGELFAVLVAGGILALFIAAALGLALWRKSARSSSGSPRRSERIVILTSSVTSAISLAIIVSSLAIHLDWFDGDDDREPSVEIFTLPAGSHPAGIARAADGAIWFTQHDSDQIGRISPSGDIRSYPIPTREGSPFAITPGPDGNMWFTEGRPDAESGNRIGRITPNGDVREFPLFTENANPVGIATGSDKKLWFTEYNGEKIGRIDPATGQIDEFPLPSNTTDVGHVTQNSRPDQIVAGPDGALWFTEFFGNRIGRITTDGEITEYPVPTPNAHPVDIVLGNDGDLWFTEFDGNRIGRISANGTIRAEFDLRTAQAGPAEIVVGSDLQLWFAELKANKVGRITTDGKVTEFELPIGNGQPQGICLGSDGSLWLTIPSSDKIVRFRP